MEHHFPPSQKFKVNFDVALALALNPPPTVTRSSLIHTIYLVIEMVMPMYYGSWKLEVLVSLPAFDEIQHAPLNLT
jgi:hypothetical protein